MNPVRVMALLEARVPAGPAGNLIITARTLKELGVAHVRVVTFVRGSGSNLFVEACQDMGVEVEIVRERFRFDPVLPQLRAAVAAWQPEILQSHNIKSHLFIRLSGLQRHYPWIAFIHGYTAENLKMKAYNQVDRWSLLAADRVVAVCGTFAERVRGWGVSPERILVRHNAVSPMPHIAPDAPERLRASLGIPAGVPVVLAVGRLSPEKAHADLVRAAAVIRSRALARDFRVVIAGVGQECDRLVRLCDSLGVSDRVVFAGPRSDIPVFLAMADVFVLPSLWEGSPNALLEAMMAGKAIVATAVGGVPEMLRDGVDGALVPPGAPEAMAGRVAEMLNDPQQRRRFGQSAREWVTANYSREEYARSISEIYQNLLALRVRTAREETD